jgi:hypothetical protein
MADQIYTKWHKAIELLHADRLFMMPPGDLVRLTPNEVNYNSLITTMEVAAACVQSYVLSDEVRGIMDDKIPATMRDLIDAGITQLPFPVMSIEYTVSIEPNEFHGGGQTTIFTLLFENATKPGGPKPADGMATAFTFQVMKLQGKEGLILCPFNAGLNPQKTPEGEAGVQVNYYPAGWMLNPVEFQNKYSKNIWLDSMNDMAYALNSSLVLLNTRGISQERVTSMGKLNKARVKSNKPPIPEHIVVRIGHVYDRDGKQHAYTGRNVRVHWRAGHTRQQPIGPRAEGKTTLIYIKPTLVNFEPGGALPSKPTHIVKV